MAFWELPAGKVVDVCNDYHNGKLPLRSNDVVTDGSPIIDQANPFRIFDANHENVLYSGCVFKGSGIYEPLGRGSYNREGWIAGTLTCNNGFKRVCRRPQETNYATTCGGKPLNECGELGKGCTPYFQQLAVCRL
jgi:hypothetical protein